MQCTETGEKNRAVQYISYSWRYQWAWTNCMGYRILRAILLVVLRTWWWRIYGRPIVLIQAIWVISGFRDKSRK